MLRIFIAVNYPCIPENECQILMSEIIGGRRALHRDKGAAPKPVSLGAPAVKKDEIQADTWGYTDDQISQYRSKMKMINDRWAGTFGVAKTVGTGKTIVSN